MKKILLSIWNWIKRIFIGALIDELEKYKAQLEAQRDAESSLLQQIGHLSRENESLQANIIKAANKYTTDVNALNGKIRAKDLEITLLNGQVALKKATGHSKS